VAGFYAARDRRMPPLLWPSIAPPFTHEVAKAADTFEDYQQLKSLVFLG